MNRLLIKKTLHESMLLFIACASMIFVFCWTRVWIVCQFDLQKFQPLLDQFRRFEKFSPVPLEQLLTYPGSIGMSFSEPVLILCIMVWGISRGSDVVSGELGRGTMEMLLSRPVGRIRLVAIHTSICVVGLALLCTCAWLGLYAGIKTNSVNVTLNPSINFRLPFIPIDVPIPTGASKEVATPLAEFVEPTLYTLPCLNLFAFGFFILGVSTLLSSIDRYRWRTIGVVIGFYVIQLLVFLLSKTIASMRFLENITFLSSYQPDAIVHYVQKNPDSAWAMLAPESTQSTVWPHMLGPLGLSVLLIVGGTLLITYGMLHFRRRDLPAPL